MDGPSSPNRRRQGTNRQAPLQIKQEPFKADAADPKKKVFVEFLSERDATDGIGSASKTKARVGLGTVHSYDLPKTAAYVAERVKRQATDKLYFGTFYDPLAGTLDLKKRAAELLAAGAAVPTNQAVTPKSNTLEMEEPP